MRILADLLVPPLCLSCRVPVAEPGRLCAPCWSEVKLIGGPVCPGCGLPYPHPVPAGTRCGACLRAPPAFEAARAAGLYEGPLRGLVLGLKHGDRWDCAPLLAGLMAGAGAELLAEADLLVPVPLHAIRRIGRRFNQSALLARALALRTGRPLCLDALMRARPTRPQVGLSREARARNVRGAFRVRPARLARIEGRRILLVDDVLTSGATADACARALLKGGARAVCVLTALRVGEEG
ncbi:MAG: ComF family protein [Alphaproteobacteria bacterium]|nr:ComF family protein [Alphaproteobacteria bacterium]